MLTHFNLTNDNPFWTLLRDANQLHITSRQKHGELLELCKSRGVKFEDIKNHLLKEAKKCGLYRSTYYDPKTKKMIYPPESQLKDVNWFVTLRNFLTWVKNNFVSYTVTVTEAAKKKAPRRKAVIRTVSPDGTSSQRDIHIEGASVQEVIGSSASPNRGIVATNSAPPINAPMQPDAGMSLAQVQSIILRNFAVLGKICEEKGDEAIEAFNDLMLVLGCEDEMI